jgi:DNA-binding Xre family transcriptional regulator
MTPKRRIEEGEMATVFRLREVMEGEAEAPSIRKVARDTGLAYNTVFAIYHNKAGRADLATLDALAKALDCEPGELIGRPGVKAGRRARG